MITFHHAVWWRTKKSIWGRKRICLSAFRNWRLRHSQLQWQAEIRALEKLYHKSSKGWSTERQIAANNTERKNKYHLAAYIAFRDRFNVRDLLKISFFCCQTLFDYITGCLLSTFSFKNCVHTISMAGTCECGNEHFGSTKCGEFLG